MKKKELYEAPSVETYDLVPEGKILGGSEQYGSDGSAGPESQYHDIPGLL